MLWGVMGKIYCKNCIFFHDGKEVMVIKDQRYCNLSTLKHYKIKMNKITGVDESYYLSSRQIAKAEYFWQVCGILNKNNDCKYFEGNVFYDIREAFKGLWGYVFGEKK